MAFQVSPGVAVKEIDLTTVVPAVATSIGAFVGSFEWGPVEQVTLVSSEDKLSALFGAPSGNVLSTDYLTAAAFLSYTNALKNIRIVPEDAKNASVDNPVTIVVPFHSQLESTAVGDVITQISGTDSSTVIANGTVIDQSIDGVGVAAKRVLTIRETEGTFVANEDNALRINGGEVLKATPDGSSEQVTVDIDSVESSLVKVKNLEQFENGVDISAGGAFVAKYVGALGNSLEISVLKTSDFTKQVTDVNGNVTTVSKTRAELTEDFPEALLFDSAPAADEVHVVITDKDGVFTGAKETVLETFSFLSTIEGARGADGSNVYFADVLNSSSAFVYVGDVAAAAVSGTYTLLGGSAGSFSVNQDNVSEELGALISGWDLLKDPEVEDVNLLIIGGRAPTVARHVVQNIAEVRKDCVAFLSPQSEDVVGAIDPLTNVIDYRNAANIDSSYGVMDSGWKYTFNKYQDRFEFIPLAGDIAGLAARTDAERDAWFSPAGFNRGNIKNVVRLAFNPDQAQRDELYKVGVNPVVNFKGNGPILFGDKTLQRRPSAFDRINVRRLFIVLEKAISTAAKFSWFEFNDQFTRAQFVSLVEPFLRQVQSRRGIFDFKVVCDETNNTPQVIDSNQFVGSIFIKPARSINFITLNFVAVRTGVEFSEVVGSV